jgi:hypothetical protein
MAKSSTLKDKYTTKQRDSKMYFEHLPSLYYSTDGKTIDIATDIITRIELNNSIKNNTLIYRNYEVKDGQTPEIVSHIVYGDSRYHWVILIINEIIDPVTDWYISTDSLNRMIQAKYENPDSTYFYENVDGVVVDRKMDAYAYFPVSYRMYEERENDKKRFIKILDPEILPAFVEEFKALMKDGD